MEYQTYKKYMQISKTICGNDERAQDLLHDTLIQFTKNQKFNTLSPKDRVFYITRALKNQFYSNNSSFNRTYRKYQFDEIPDKYELVDTEYDETPTLDWINETLNKELKDNPSFWYNKGLFDIWREHNCIIDRVHKQTKIPKYSIIDTIEGVKSFIRHKWLEYKNK
jgi:hypothetical protein